MRTARPSRLLPDRRTTIWNAWFFVLKLRAQSSVRSIFGIKPSPPVGNGQLGRLVPRGQETISCRLETEERISGSLVILIAWTVWYEQNSIVLSSTVGWVGVVCRSEGHRRRCEFRIGRDCRCYFRLSCIVGSFFCL